MDPSLPVTSKYLQVSEFIKNVSRLQTHGANIHIWETQLKDSIRVTTGIEDYLAVPMTREDDIIMDGWVLSMIECSIDEELLETIEFNLTAYDAFRTLILHFNPPNRARHLSIWAEIIHRHQFYHESAVHHINFIRKCLQNLSASKFVWTKDYFLGIMYQAGLPSDSTRSVDRVNLLIQSSIYLLAYPPHISSIIREAISDTERQINARITDALKSSPKPETGHQPRSNLMSLPEEILESLIEHVGAVSVKHTWTIRDQQWSRLTQYTTEDLPRPGWIYPPNPTPLLTSVQALSAVNSTFLRLCNKSLWKNLRFPTQLPSPITHWTDILLPKYGALVKSLDISLCYDWFRPLGLEMRGFTYDNILFLDSVPSVHPYRHDQSATRITPHNVDKILSLCPSIQRLWLKCPDNFFRDHEDEDPEALHTRLFKTILSITQLRHLELYGGGPHQITDSFLNQLLPRLPLLESLALYSAQRSSQENVYQLGQTLSDLQHLSHLRLRHSAIADASWRSYSGPPNLKYLRLEECDEVSELEKAYSLIQNFASKITDLHLLLPLPFHHFNTEFSESKPPYDYTAGLRFELPALQSLTLHCTTVFEPLSRFQNCKDLRMLTCYSLGPYGWSVVNDLMANSTWPKLRTLDLNHLDNHFHVDEETLQGLRETCIEKGIELIHF